MPGLTQQRLIIDRLEQATAIERLRLIEACRNIDPPVGNTMVAAGTALIIADLAPGISALAGLFSGNPGPDERRKQCVKVFLEAPQIAHTLRRLLG